MATVPIRYACAACGATSAGTATFDPPAVGEDTARAMRQLERLKEAHGRPAVDDPVGELERSVAETLAKDELTYATCPACGARNPAGVAAAQAEDRRFKWATFAALCAAAALAWRWPWVALVLPALDLLVLRPLGVIALRRQGSPVRWLRLLAGVAVDLLMVALVLLLPGAAPLLPLVGAGSVLLRKPGDPTRFASAAGHLHFETAGEAPRAGG